MQPDYSQLQLMQQLQEMCASQIQNQEQQAKSSTNLNQPKPQLVSQNQNQQPQATPIQIALQKLQQKNQVQNQQDKAVPQQQPQSTIKPRVIINQQQMQVPSQEKQQFNIQNLSQQHLQQLQKLCIVQLIKTQVQNADCYRVKIMQNFMVVEMKVSNQEQLTAFASQHIQQRKEPIIIIFEATPTPQTYNIIDGLQKKVQSQIFVQNNNKFDYTELVNLFVQFIPKKVGDTLSPMTHVHMANYYNYFNLSGTNFMSALFSSIGVNLYRAPIEWLTQHEAIFNGYLGFKTKSDVFLQSWAIHDGKCINIKPAVVQDITQPKRSTEIKITTFPLQVEYDTPQVPPINPLNSRKNQQQLPVFKPKNNDDLEIIPLATSNPTIELQINKVQENPNSIQGTQVENTVLDLIKSMRLKQQENERRKSENLEQRQQKDMLIDKQQLMNLNFDVQKEQLNDYQLKQHNKQQIDSSPININQEQITLSVKLNENTNVNLEEQIFLLMQCNAIFK
ncbi:Hypothetical_protein [Hexamita inflata]|uniref:Hypothetical_protein n=1 Tax=Hexamita inflata TaxID=28002 RepID=A0AA86Q5P6_9EUKA|nr:Hypothetical protein HINF_LOCUS39313 [Hexamita inflata]